jgi:hypothetical protein
MWCLVRFQRRFIVSVGANERFHGMVSIGETHRRLLFVASYRHAGNE